MRYGRFQLAGFAPASGGGGGGGGEIPVPPEPPPEPPVLENDETVFDVEFVDWEIRENYCQLQIQVGRFVDQFDSITIDWGDGTVDHQTTYLAWHNYTAVGRYTIRIGREARWFRVWDCYAVTKQGQPLVARPQMWLRQWSDYLDSAEGSFCGWSDPSHGGLKGTLPRWGRSITTTYCCFEYCKDIEGPFPEWTDAITDACGTYQHVRLAGQIPEWGRNIVRCGFCYNDCQTVTGRFPAWPRNCVEFNACYNGCTGLYGEIPPWPECAEEIDSVFKGCTGAVGIIPKWPEAVKMLSGCYWDCPNLTGAWTDDPALLMPEEKVRYSPDSDYYRCYDVVTGCSDAVRSLFWDEPWGGTIPRPTPAPTGP